MRTPIGARLLADDALEGARKRGIGAVTDMLGSLIDAVAGMQFLRRYLHAQGQQKLRRWLTAGIAEIL